MIKFISIVASVAVLFVVLLSVYLAPNDLRGCGDHPGSKLNCQKADAIIAVSGGNTSLRAAEAIRLYENGWADTLIFSGAAQDTSGPSNAEVMKKQAISDGVPAHAVITEDFSRTTHQNAEKTDALIKERGLSNLIIVTSPYHQRRAGLEFKRLLPTSISIRNHPVLNDPDWPWYWWATPRGWWLAGGEVVKITAAHAGESQ